MRRPSSPETATRVSRRSPSGRTRPSTILDRPLTVGSPLERFRHDEIRVDGTAKVSGQAQYTADLARPGMLWAAFVTAPVAHARIVSIDVSAARELPGVHAVLTGRDVGEHYFGRRLCDWPVLSIDRVRFVGEYVAAVAADTPEVAEAAAGLIDVEYDELPGVFDPEEALLPEAVVLHEDQSKYPFMFPKPRPQMRHPNIQGYGVTAIGDVDAGFAQADHVFEHTLFTPRYHGGYIEPRATLVWFDENGVVHVVSTTKSPFALREQLSVTTGLPKEKFVVEPAWIGGDFGAKGICIEEFPCYYLAAATGRPVKYVRTYLDDIRSSNVRHASKVTVKTGVTKDGKFVAQSIRALYDGGAYAAGKVIPTLLPGPETKTPYGIPNIKLERITVYTNSIPGGFVRAPGDVQIAFALESVTDMIATEMGIEPLELRRRNVAHSSDIDIEGHPFLDPRGAEVLDVLARESNWGKPFEEPGRARGLSLCARHIGSAKTSLVLRLHPDGGVEVRTGVTDPGMGIYTVLQRVVAADLDLPLERVRVVRGSTETVPFDPGVGGSRTTHVVGQTARVAAKELRTATEAAACTLAGAPAGTMVLREGAFQERDGAKRVSWDEVAAALARDHDGSFSVTGSYDGEPKHGEPQYNNFVGYVVDVTVDRETGAYAINDVLMAMDTGTIINPIAHQGQIDGGFIFGLGHAKTEELLVEDGRIQNLTFADYKLPTQMDAPPFRSILLEEGTGPGPFGSRAAGEVNTSGVGPALANAIYAACGARITQLPVTAERIYAALHPEEEA